MKNRKQRLFAVLAILALAALACSPFSFGGDGDNESVEEPALDDAAEDESQAQDIVTGPMSLDLEDSGAFKEIEGDYFLTMDFRFEGVAGDGSEVSGALFIEGSNQADPHAYSLTMTPSGDADLETQGPVTYTETEDTLYFSTVETGCVIVPAQSEDSPFNDFVDTGGFLTGTVERVLPDERVNGVPSYHYAITQANLDADDEESLDVEEIESGDLYIARDGGYVVRIRLEGSGRSSLLTGGESIAGDISYQLDFEPSDNVSVALPEGCEEIGSAESDFPVMPDATAVTSFEGFLSYSTASDVDGVVEFYRSEMADRGWTESEDFTAGTTIGLNFTMGERSVSIVISEDPNSGEVTVLLAEE